MLIWFLIVTIFINDKSLVFKPGFLNLIIALFTSDDNDMGGMGDNHRSIRIHSDDKCQMTPMVERIPEVELRKLAAVVHNTAAAEHTPVLVAYTLEQECRHQRRYAPMRRLTLKVRVTRGVSSFQFP
jgi:hypothetical protein